MFTEYFKYTKYVQSLRNVLNWIKNTCMHFYVKFIFQICFFFYGLTRVISYSSEKWNQEMGGGDFIQTFRVISSTAYSKQWKYNNIHLYGSEKKKNSSNVVSSALGYLGSFCFYKDSGLNDRSLCKMDVRKRTPSVGNLSRNSTSLNAPLLLPPTPPVFLKISFARKRERSFISYSFFFLLLFFYYFISGTAVIS